MHNARGASPEGVVATSQRSAPSRRGGLSTVLMGLVLAFPAATWAICGGGGASNLPLPAVSYLRSYRASFSAPARMAVDALGNVYVADPGQEQVIVRAPNGRVISRTGGLGHPISVAVGNAATIYVGDAQSGSVTAFGPDWQPVFQLGRGAGEFLLPNDLAVDTATGNVYVADSPAHLVRVYSATGALLQSFGGQGRGDGLFNFPAGVAVDAVAREVLVVDQLNYRIQIFDVAGTFRSCFGAQGSGPGQFNMPQGVSTDGEGRVYVADAVEGRIQVLDRSGGLVGYIGDFGEAAGQLRTPIGMVIDRSNRLFVAAANNARLEVFGLGAFADPEAVLPAVIHMEPDLIDRASPNTDIAGYIEVPGYSLDQIVPGSVVANGISAATIPIVVGDHDGNGVPDIRVAFDRTALLATLPADGVGTVALSGLLGAKQFEGSAAVDITTCGPGTICSLGDADPQCNEAVCLAAVGCTIQPKADGTGCEDGNACTIDDVCNRGACIGASLSCDDHNVCTDDSCDPVNGCVYASNTAPCDDGSACTVADTCAGGVCSGTVLTCDDGNVCTDDTCDPATGCVYTSNTAPCDDGNACTIADICGGGVCGGAPLTCDDGNVCTDDTCDPASGCVYTHNTASCDDGDPGTVRDTCDGSGRCRGQNVAGNYAVLLWPLEPSGHQSAVLAAHAHLLGDLCGETVHADSFGEIDGDVVAWASGGRAVTFGVENRVGGNVVTGGGGLTGLEQVTIGGRVDQSGTAAELDACAAARYRVASRRADFVALPPTAGCALGPIRLAGGTQLQVPAVGQLGAGQIVIEAVGVRLGPASTLTMVGTGATETVVVHVRGNMRLARAARIEIVGMPPERVTFVVDGSVSLQGDTSVAGSVFAAGHVRAGRASRVSGALLGSAIHLAPYATVDLHPFVGW